MRPISHVSLPGRRVAVWALATLWCCLALNSTCLCAQAQTFTTLHLFDQSANEWSNPNSALIQGSDGNLYGTTGSSLNSGSVFKLDGFGNITVLYSFNNFDGDDPNGLIQASDGYFYGTAYEDGENDEGTVFKMDMAGNITFLHSFSGTDGAYPTAALLQGSDGNFYGTTSAGGANNAGTVFKMDAAGNVAVLHSFSDNPDGANPQAALIQGSDGFFYGTTYNGGANDAGTAFRMDVAGNVTVLHSFGQLHDGAGPTAALIQANDGFFYGTTTYGGAYSHGGTAFRMDAAGNVTVLHSFGAISGNDGDTPEAALIQASDGNFYGTTSLSGASRYGTVFKMDAAGNVTTLHSFSNIQDGAYPSTSLIQASDGTFYGATSYTVFKMDSAGNVTALGRDGDNPAASLLQGSDGYFYGTTPNGGLSGIGTVFKMNTAGNVTILYSFGASSNDGAGPSGSLIQASDGYFYGTTGRGGAYSAYYGGYGTVFKMDTAGNVTILYSFSGNLDGAYPYASLIQGNDGFFYGTTEAGGANGDGTVFKMDAAGNLTVLHSFNGTDGARSYAALIQASDGFLYGTTSAGGANNSGTVFKIDTAGDFTLLHSFTSYIDGAPPWAALIQGSDGFFYGTTTDGGAHGYGIVFKMDTAGNVTVLHSFKGTDGANPYASLIQASDGYFYGTTRIGGAAYYNSYYYGDGTVFKMDAAGNVTVLHSFNDTDAYYPTAALLQASNGLLYGTTAGEYEYNAGSIFQLDLGLPAKGSVSGKSTLQGCVNPAQTLTFTFRPTKGGSSFTKTVILASDGSFSLTGIPPGTYNLAIKGSKWLQQVVSVNTTTGSVFGLNVTLLAGDVNNDNQISLADYVLLRNAFGSKPGRNNWNPNADLNCDGQVSLADYVLLRNNFGLKGDP